MTITAADAKILDQKDKIKAFYEVLQDIPEEKQAFDLKKSSLNVATIYDDPQNLRWMAVRIKQRIQEATHHIQEAVEQSREGIVDLSHKNICDLTLKDFSAPLIGIWKINLSGNYLRSLPPIFYQKPYIEKLDAVGNLTDVEHLFYEYRRHNQVSIDLLEVLKVVQAEEFEGCGVYRDLFREILSNPAKKNILELASKVNYVMTCHPIHLKTLSIHPEGKKGELMGGIKGFIPLESFRGLVSLDLSNCHLEHRAPTDWLSALPYLTSINLSHTPLRELPKSLQGKSLTELILRNTAITSLPEWVADFDELRILDVSHTPLAKLPASFIRWKIKQVNLAHTGLLELPVVPATIDFLSLRGTAILQLCYQNFLRLQAGNLEIDGSNAPTLQYQKQIGDLFYTSYLAHLVLMSELYKKKPSCMPTIIKTHAVGLEYILLIAGFSLMLSLESLFIPFKMACSPRNGINSGAFKTFKGKEEQAGMHFLWIYFLFHCLPVTGKVNDIKSLGHLLCNRS